MQQDCLNNEQIINRKIPCVRLSEWCKENNVQATFIKMDIEGAELDALRGAEELIKANKPKLAICLYHHVHDLWTIPLYVKSLVPEYKLFCRENRSGTEFVMYATV